MSPGEAAVAAASLSAVTAIIVAALNAYWGRQARATEAVTADERRRQERAEAWARFEGVMTARFDELTRRFDRTDERTDARFGTLEERLLALPCWGCPPPATGQVINLKK